MIATLIIWLGLCALAILGCLLLCEVRWHYAGSSASAWRRLERKRARVRARH